MLLRRVIEHVKAQNWVAVFLDFVIVVVGVFFGFQVTAWNDARTDRLQEHVYLERLREDIELSIVRNETNVAFMRRHADYGTLILNALEECRITLSEEDKFASGLYLAGKITQPVLLRTAIDELKATGKFEVIQNIDLRKAIAALVEIIEFRSVIDEKIFLRASPAVAAIERKVMVLKTEPWDPAQDVVAAAVRFDLEALCADAEFAHAIATTRSSTFASVFFTEDIIRMQREVLAMIDAELAGDG